MENFSYPISEAVDAWTFKNVNSGLCLQDGDWGGFIPAYQEPCKYGSLQTWAEWGDSSGYSIITSWGDEACEHWVNGVDWVYTVGIGYSGWGTNKCEWK